MLLPADHTETIESDDRFTENIYFLTKTSKTEIAENDWKRLYSEVLENTCKR